jgi:hypothetical protein
MELTDLICRKIYLRLGTFVAFIPVHAPKEYSLRMPL